jgi:hypothetical protein
MDLINDYAYLLRDKQTIVSLCQGEIFAKYELKILTVPQHKTKGNSRNLDREHVPNIKQIAKWPLHAGRYQNRYSDSYE